MEIKGGGEEVTDGGKEGRSGTGALMCLDDIDLRWGGRGAPGFDRRPRPDERQRRGRGSTGGYG
jgi:hypothetical protein